MTIPSNWTESSIADLIPEDGVFIDGDWVESKDQDADGQVRLIQLADVKEFTFVSKSNRYLTQQKAAELGCTFLKKDDVLIARMPDPIGRACIFPFDEENRFVTVVDVAIVRTNSKTILPRLLMFFINSKEFRTRIIENSGGSTRQRISRSNLSKLTLPLPPLPEQKRIVAKLDKLFTHLDQLKVRLEKIPDLLKQFRQAVLTQAVTGKLTEECRSVMNLWRIEKVGSLCDHTLGKMLDVKKNKGTPTQYLRNINVRWGEFDLSDAYEMKATDEDRQKFSIQDGDILVCEGGEPGRCAIWNKGENRFIFQKALHRLRCNDDVLPAWITFNLQRDANMGTLEEHFTGTTIKHFTLRALRQYQIPVPPIDEQKEIVRRVDSLFALADRIEASYKTLQKKIDQLPQAVLNKAFRGELVVSALNEPTPV
jgi:type I restriction enzyme, S subunit